MRRALFAFILTSCFPREHYNAPVEPYVRPVDAEPVSFEGPRVVTVIGPADDVEKLFVELGYRGFLARRLASGVGQPSTRYVAKIDGVCGFRGVVDATLSVEVIDTQKNRRMLTLVVKDSQGCPDDFFVYAARFLSKVWPESL